MEFHEGGGRDAFGAHLTCPYLNFVFADGCSFPWFFFFPSAHTAVCREATSNDKE